MKYALYVQLLLAVTLLAATGCGSRPDTEADGRRTVTVSIPPQAWLLKAIAGDSVKVNTLMSAGTNPETFEPGVNTIRNASTSDLLMLSGNLGFESTLARRIAANNPDVKVVDTSAGIDPIYGTHSHGNHTHTVADPHTWTSVRNARVIASNMLASLIDIDPARADYYSERAARLDAHLDSLDVAVAGRLDSLNVRSFMVWHPSLSYFARDYGLEQISLGAEGRETTIRGAQAVIDRASQRGTTVLFVQADFDSDRARSLVSETGATLITINPLDPDWEAQINIITDALDPR
ncbi:MAG: zinc ABC transporter substrate-binding protein [Muribaculaceae bacterium]|nr:zinc ABC transporter substrate-binding protein [Muribaculaceae bacterium]